LFRGYVPTKHRRIGRFIAGILFASACSSPGTVRPASDGSLDAPQYDAGGLDHTTADTHADVPAWADDELAPEAPIDEEASSADGGPGGDGGSPSDIGGPDLAADGVAGAITACRPDCIERVFGPCDAPKAGTCSNTGSTICYSNGVKLATTLLDGGAGEPYSKITVFQPDGTICGWYTATAEADGAALGIYYDARGTEIGRQKHLMPDAALGAVLYTCDGQTFVVTSEQLQSQDCQRLQPRDCPMGTCP